MPRQNFISVPASDSIQAIFDEFVKRKNITKTAALNDMIELYMLATDEKLYLELKNKHLKVSNIKENILSKQQNFDEAGNICDTFMFMKLSNTKDINGNDLSGIKTINIYIKDEVNRGYTWFSTDSLYPGMAKGKVNYFTRRISLGEKVMILFAIGAAAGGNNEIQYSGEVLDIVSSPNLINAPEQNAYPLEWSNYQAKIWIKIKNIHKETSLTTNMLIIKETGSPLNQVISNSQFHFGYVVKR